MNPNNRAQRQGTKKGTPPTVKPPRRTEQARARMLIFARAIHAGRAKWRAAALAGYGGKAAGRNKRLACQQRAKELLHEPFVVGELARLRKLADEEAQGERAELMRRLWSVARFNMKSILDENGRLDMKKALSGEAMEIIDSVRIDSTAVTDKEGNTVTKQKERVEIRGVRLRAMHEIAALNSWVQNEPPKQELDAKNMTDEQLAKDIQDQLGPEGVAWLLKMNGVTSN